MLNLHLLYEYSIHGQPHACAQIRLLRPFSHPMLASYFNVSSGLDLPDHPVEVVVLERLWRPDITMPLAEALVKAIRAKNAKFIYTIDDNLVDLFLDQPWQTYPTTEHRMIIRYFLREADGVIVSTANLKARLSRLNPKIEVVGNALDERLFPTHSAEQQPYDVARPVTIGYMGTRTHLGDLMSILSPLREVLTKYSNKVLFQTIGVAGDAEILAMFKGLPIEIIEVGAHHEYVKFTAWAAQHIRWDIGLAPLADTALNFCKSDIKFLDYSILGIPGIYSQSESYRYTVAHRKTGWLADNTRESWLNAMETLIENASLRQELACQASEYVLSQRILKQRALDWYQAIEQLIGSGAKPL